jgi:hypothetical protein
VTCRSCRFCVHFCAYAQCSKREPTSAQCHRLFISLCFLVPQHVSANSYAVIRGYCYKLHMKCIKWKLQNGETVKNGKNCCKIIVLVWCYDVDICGLVSPKCVITGVCVCVCVCVCVRACVRLWAIPRNGPGVLIRSVVEHASSEPHLARYAGWPTAHTHTCNYAPGGHQATNIDIIAPNQHNNFTAVFTIFNRFAIL